MTIEQNMYKGWNLINTYAELPKIFYTKIRPTPVRDPNIVLFNNALAECLGLITDEIYSEEGASQLSGNRLPKNSVPIAQAYAGHQFGYFTFLGDGRAVLLGEQVTPDGKIFDIQLKGCGKTPYSRQGDGRAALGPMLREYIISEAMHELGIPTTRSLAVVTTGEQVLRESILPGAVLTRVASSHIRVGTFEYIAKWGTYGELKALADYTLKRHFSRYEHCENQFLFLLKQVIIRQASLIAKWQLAGFIHGVMNTDNMSISGESIDYGPCAFMDEYDPDTVFSSIDIMGRYAYKNQPEIAKWNLTIFANTLIKLIDKNIKKAKDMAYEAVSEFDNLYSKNYISGMRAKLGLFYEENNDESLIYELLNIMKKYKADYTNTFVALTFDESNDNKMFCSIEFKNWQEKWQARLSSQPEQKNSSHLMMKNSNPAVIPRNYRVEEALEAAVKYQDYKKINKLMSVLSKPYAHLPEQNEYKSLPKKSDVPYRTYCGT